MAEKLSDNVGKKIVEALKMQNQPVEQEPIRIEEDIEEVKDENPVEEQTAVQETIHVENSDSDSEVNSEFVSPPLPNIDVASIINGNSAINNLDEIFQNTINQNISNSGFSDTQADFEYPNNVAILTHLISKLPAGVSKQTGALIIRQTMEALGIPMKAVVGEAKHVQESLTAKARECQKNIIDYRKQIATLEIKGQQFQKQAVAMSEMINLFISTGV